MKKLPLLEIPIVLASASPRRKYLLEQVGFRVQILPSCIDENYPDDLRILDIPSFLATAKAHAVLPDVAVVGNPVIGADTIVVLAGNVIGKPLDRGDAIEMLTNLSGKTHEVYTGVCIVMGSKQSVFTCRSEVTFTKLTLPEIKFYIDVYNPMDKAGSYGIQEWLGWCKIEKINGSYTNIMGLPMELVYKNLNNLVHDQLS